MMAMPMHSVRLYGALGQRFGKQHEMAVCTAHEAVRALSATMRGFKEFLLDENGYGYKVIVAGKAKRLEEIHEPLAQGQEIKIIPIVGGAKKGGLGLILLGALLFFGAPILAGAIGAGSVGAAVALYGAKIGMALMLGGIIQLLSPQRKTQAVGEKEDLSSHSFDGPVSTNAQGGPVPVGYGRCIVGGVVISAGLSIDDISPAPAPPPPPPPELPPDQQWDYSA